MNALNYDHEATAMVVGVGLMGQHMALNVGRWLGLSRLVLVDHATEIQVGSERQPLSQFGAACAEPGLEVLTETVNVASEDEVSDLFARYRNVRYFLYTAGISPAPLTAPEALDRDQVMAACEVNLWGALNFLKQGVSARAFSQPRTHGVLVLSTSATAGSEGRASAAYEMSKGGLLNLLQLHSRHFLEQHGLVLNGLAPSPLRGPMAAQNPVSAGRLQAVENAMPIGGLTSPQHIAAATMYLWARECWCVGEVLTVDGGYTKHRPVFGPLPG